MKKEIEKQTAESVRIIPLGGLDKIGMNITVFEYGESIIVVDCGISFPDESMPGVDLVIPDVTYLKNNKDKVKGFVITHGHEDHIGAIPYIIKELNVPIYATRLTMGLIEHKLKEHKLMKKTRRKIVKHGGNINLGDFRIEFIKTNHSIADASALAIHTPAGVILHTGDFKIDYTPLVGDFIDLQRFSQLGKKGVLALLCDSTNAERAGFTVSERLVAQTFHRLFSENKNNRIIVATFASNVDRVQLIMNTAYEFGRKVILQGRSMLNVIAIADELGYITIPENTLIPVEEMNQHPDEKLVFITTGSQGESMAALSRMADSSHKKVTIKPGDAIIFSSTPIPGNVKAVSKVMNELAVKGANVIYQDTHVSGHACQEEIKLIYSLTKPQYVIPVHGEYHHLTAQAALAAEAGFQKENIFILRSGSVLQLSKESGKVVGNVPAGEILVDGLGIGDVGRTVLKDRHNLSEHGIIIVVLTVAKNSGKIMAGPDVVSRGFIYIRESEKLMSEIRKVVHKSTERFTKSQKPEWQKLKAVIRDDLSDYLWNSLKRNPVILPVIIEI